MLERVECKVFLPLLLVLSLLSLVSIITAVVLSIVWQYVGFMMDSALSSYICNSYLTLKLHYNITYNYNAIFIGSLVSITFQIFVTIHLVYLLFKYCKSDQRYFQQLTQSVFKRLYIGYSMSLLGASIGMGYYTCYIIEQGWKCLNYIYTNWLILGAIFTAVVIFLLICWIYLLCFWISKKRKFDELKEESITQPSDGVQQPVNMIGFFETVKQIIKKETKCQPNPINEQLLQEPISQGDHASQLDPGKQRLQHMTFEQYVKKQKQKHEKEHFQDNVIKRLLQQQQQKFLKHQHDRLEAKLLAQHIKKNKQKSSVALSPDDPDFNQIFLESEQEVQAQTPEQPQCQEKFEYYPANFTPTTKKQLKQFQKYKKRLLDKHKKNQFSDLSTSLPASSTNGATQRHPQNIGKGRSRKVLQKYIKKNKKPCRNQSLYLRSNFQNSRYETLSQPIQQIDQQDEFSGQFNQNVPDVPLQMQKQQSFVKKSPKLSVQETPKKLQQQQILCFHKSKTKSQSKKKLFQQQQKFLTNQAFSSILSSLVKGVQQASLQSKLKDLRKRRNQNENVSKNKRSDKLIESIRSKFY